MEKHLHKSVNCLINFQKMPASRQKKETKLPEPVPAKHHSNLKNSSNVSEKSHSKPRSNFYSGLDGMEMAAQRVPYRKKLFVSQRGGFISCDKIKYQLCEISISLLKKQLYFRISVGFRRCIVGNFSLTNSDNTFGRYSMSFQFCSNQASS